jgi:hypothetical protein
MTLFICLFGIIIGVGAESLDRCPADCPDQTDTLKIWNVAANGISADPLGQIYIIAAGSLVKYDSRGDSAYSWSEPQTGMITLVDTGDPMRILAYQKDFNLLRFLNNRLAPLSEPIRLDDLGMTAPLALAVSRQGGFWILDGSTCRISHVDQQLKTLVESMPLNLPSVIGSAGYRMIESGEQILLLIPGREIQIFDLFANLIKKIPVKVSSFNVYGDRILLVYQEKILLWKDPVSVEEILFNRPGSDIREACLYQNKLLIRTPDQVIWMTR